MHQSNIHIDIELDKDKIPENISWKASDSTADEKQHAKAMMLAFWDGADKSALRIDLWTKEMMVDEMADFFYQAIYSMADTYQRATGYEDQVAAMKNFAQDFYKIFKENEAKKNK
ncbi:MAG: gliding motility protein GldC [Bacteroidota bacterium]